MHIFENPKIKTTKMRNSLDEVQTFSIEMRYFKEENSFAPKVVPKSVQTHALERIVADIESLVNASLVPFLCISTKWFSSFNSSFSRTISGISYRMVLNLNAHEMYYECQYPLLSQKRDELCRYLASDC